MAEVVGKTRRIRPRRPWFYAVGGIAVLAAVAASVSFGGGETTKPAKLRGAGPAESRVADTTVGGQGTQAYNRLVAEENRELAGKAMASVGSASFVPVPVGAGRSIHRPVEVEVSRPAAPEQKRQDIPSPRRIAAQSSGGSDDRLARDLLREMTAIRQRWDANLGVTVVSYRPRVEPAAGNPGPGAARPAAPAPPFGAGDWLYAMNDIVVDSDRSLPVVQATVISGKARGVRFSGSFQQKGEGVAMAFTGAALPDGRTVRVKAYGVDPDSGVTSLATSVDSHAFSRWAGVILSGVLTGIGRQAAGNGRTTVTNAGVGATTTVSETKEFSVRDGVLAGFGEAGTRLSRAADANFARPPTVKVAGIPIGIMVQEVER